jgi:drug/metabolite transporter (DMT)-like permease
MFSLGKMALEYSSPLFLTGTRMLLAGILLLIYVFLKQRDLLKVDKKDLFPLALFALMSIYLTNAFEFWGMQKLSAVKGCFIYSLSPFFAAFFSYLHFGEKLTLKKWLGLSIGLVGIIPGISISQGFSDLYQGMFNFSWPELSLIAAVLFSVYGWILLRLLVKGNTLSPLTVNGYGMLIGGLIALVHSHLVDVWSPLPIKAGSYFAFSHIILWMILVSNIICYNIYGFLLRKYTATLLSFTGLLSPFFAALTSWILLGETPSPVIIVSTCIVIIGLYIVYQEELKQGYLIKTRKAV